MKTHTPTEKAEAPAELRASGTVKQGRRPMYVSHEDARKAAENSAQFTPGPWLVNGTGTLPIFIGSEKRTWTDYGKTYVCEIGLNAASPDSFAEQIANARLIAEAPALFAMVKDYAENADCGNGGEHTGEIGDRAENCWHCRAVAMISKIEGRQS